MEQNDYESDAKKIKDMIASYGERVAPSVKKEVVKYYNTSPIVLYVALVASWLPFVFSQSPSTIFLPVVFTCCMIGVYFFSPESLSIYTKNEAYKDWKENYVTEEDVEKISTCTDEFKCFLLAKSNNDISKLTYRGVEYISNEYYALSDSKTRAAKSAQLSRERLKIKSDHNK